MDVWETYFRENCGLSFVFHQLINYFFSCTILQERLRKVQEEMERERRRKESEEKAVKEAEQVRHR